MKNDNTISRTEQRMNDRIANHYCFENNYDDVDDETLLRDIKLYQFANKQMEIHEVLGRERMLITAKAYNASLYYY